MMRAELEVRVFSYTPPVDRIAAQAVVKYRPHGTRHNPAESFVIHKQSQYLEVQTMD